MTQSEIKKGMFLISSPEVEMGIYYRCVILICEHTVNGSFGLIINKPLHFTLPDEILSQENLINPHIEMRAGGIIQPGQMMLLHSSETIPEQTILVSSGIFLGGDLDFLKTSASTPEGPYLRLCFGYCAWGAGALEQELLQGAWFTHPAHAKYIFETSADLIWKSILNDMGGKYSALATIPDDPSLN